MKKLVAVLAGVLLLLPSLTLALEPFNKDLKYGMMKNAEVKRMQEFLRDEGVYKGGITGNFYTLTREAVRKYQKNNGLKVTGLFDMKTRSKVNEISVAVNDAAPTNYTMDTTQNIPVGWVSNGDGTFFSPVVQVSSNQPQAPESENKTISYSENTTTSNQTTYNQPVAQKQTTTTETKTNTTQSPSSMPTSTPTSPPVEIALESTVFNQSRTVYPPYYPFYAYVNCSPTSTDNSFNFDLFDSSLDIYSVITSKTYKDIGYFTLNDQVIYNNDREAWKKSDFFDLLAKSPKIKSITIKNAGTADLRNINFSIDYDVPSAKKDTSRIVIFARGERTNMLPTTITKDTATFNFSPSLPSNFNEMLTEFYFLADTDKLKKNETIDFQIINAELENNDSTKNYKLKTPVINGSKNVLKKCDLRS